MNEIETVQHEVFPIPLTRPEICKRWRARQRGEIVSERSYPTGENNHSWRGGTQSSNCKKCGSIFYGPRWELKHRKYCSKSCYWKARIDPNKRRIRVHDKIVEKVLGKTLSISTVVHHFDRNKKNNNHSNLIICQDQAYHLFLHARKRIFDAGGHPNTDKICSKCKQIKSKTDFHISQRNDGRRCYCKPCQAKNAYERRSNGTVN